MATSASDIRLEGGGLPGGLGGEPRAAPPEVVLRSPLQLFWRRLRRDRVALVALGFLVVLVLVAVAAPLIVQLVGAHPPNEQNPQALNSFGNAQGPGNGYLLGTDELGRDVFSRTLYGARVSLFIAGVSTTLAVLIGLVLGMVAGYHGGRVDTMLSRTFDAMLGFPVLLLALGLGAACSLGHGCIPVDYHRLGLVLIVAGTLLALGLNLFAVARRRRGRALRPLSRLELAVRAGPGILLVVVGLVLAVLLGERGALIRPGADVVIFIVTLAGVPYMARIVRGQTLSLREKEFVDAARTIGASDIRILFRHVLPNLVGPVVVYATLLIPQNILFEAALSFLGVGVQPPTASWGAMIAAASTIFQTAWWYMLVPGVALLLTVLAFNVVGDGLQDTLSPRTDR